MRAGDLPVFRACQLATHIARFTLTGDQLNRLDDELAAQAAQLPWRRLLGVCNGLLAELVPDQLVDRARAACEQRYVRKLETDDPSVAYLSGRVDTADAIYFDGMLDRIADILAGQGDTDSKDVRRAKSLGILATPARATLLLAEAAETDHVAAQALRSRAGELFDAAGRRRPPRQQDTLFLRWASVPNVQPIRFRPTRPSTICRPSTRSIRCGSPHRRPFRRFAGPVLLLPKSTVYVHVAESTL